MKPNEKNTEKILKETLNLFGEVSAEEAEAAQAQTLAHLESQRAEVAPARASNADSVRPARSGLGRRGLAVATIAAAIVMAVLLPTRVLQSAPAVLEDATGQHQIQYGELVRPTGDMSAMLSLSSGQRVETRSMSEFMLERAEDGGTRIRLNTGGLIVNAAAQHGGNLYVQTKEMTASVGGALSLVKAEEQGSSVAAIGGEVRVQQGTTERKLGPGQQVTSNPRMESLSVKEELAWSREATSHAALLQQAPVARAAQTKPEKLEFEVASIRPTAPYVPGSSTGRGAGAGDGSANRRPGPKGCVPDSANLQKFDPRRVYIPMATLTQLIAHSYPIQNYPGWARPSMGSGLDGNFSTPSAERCGMLSMMGILTGGPDWVRTEQWDLEAAIPEGLFTSKPNTLTDPKIQQMIRDLLVERFKLVIRREIKEVPVYLLKVGKDGPKLLKENSGKDSSVILNARGQVQFVRDPNGVVTFNSSSRSLRGMSGWNVSMEVLAQSLAGGPGSLRRLILDRTGITGRYDFQFDDDVPINWSGDLEALNQSHVTAKQNLIKALGLELEEAKASFEVWVIDRAEKPSEN